MFELGLLVSDFDWDAAWLTVRARLPVLPLLLHSEVVIRTFDLPIHYEHIYKVTQQAYVLCTCTRPAAHTK